MIFRDRNIYMAKEKVLVTGSSGFLGKNVVSFLKSEGYHIIPFDIVDGKDILSKDHLEKNLSVADYICHLAAVGDVYLASQFPERAACIGVEGTANLVHVANRFPNIKKIIYASTWEVYGSPRYQPLDEEHPCNPDHPYSIAKYGGELMLRSCLNHIPWIILRLGSAYGLHMRSNAVIPLFIHRAKKGEELIISGNGSQIRQFTYADDIAQAVQLAIETKVENEIFNIVSSEIQTIKQIAEMVVDKIPVAIKFAPERKGDVQSATVVAKKAKKILGWDAETKFAEGFEKTFEHNLSYVPVGK